MKAILTVSRNGETRQETVDIPGLALDDRPAKLLDAARKLCNEQALGTLLSAKFIPKHRVGR